MRMEKPARKESSNMLMMTDIIKGVNAVLNPGKPEINWFAPDPEAKAAIHIRDGRIDKSLSNSKALYGGTIDDQNLKNVKVVAYDGRDGGIYAEGPGSKVTVDGAYISTAGNGSGIGGPSSGAAVKRGASMTLKTPLSTPAAELDTPLPQKKTQHCGFTILSSGPTACLSVMRFLSRQN